VFILCGVLILLAMTYFFFARRNGRLAK